MQCSTCAIAEYLGGLNDPLRVNPSIVAPSSAVLHSRSLHLRIASCQFFSSDDTKKKNHDYIASFVETCLSREAIAVLNATDREILPLLCLFAHIQSIYPILVLKITSAGFLKLGSQSLPKPEEYCCGHEEVYEVLDNVRVDKCQNRVTITLGSSETLKKCVVAFVKSDDAKDASLHVGIDAHNRLYMSFCADSSELINKEIVIHSLRLLSSELCGTDQCMDFSIALFTSDTIIVDTLEEIGFKTLLNADGKDIGYLDLIHFESITQISELATSNDSSFPLSNLPDGQCDLDVFMLSGQSNMAGRGEVSQLTEMSPDSDIFTYLKQDGSLKEPYSRQLIYYDPAKVRWKSSEEHKTVFNIHESVDILKNVGIGPGVSFSCNYISSRPNSKVGLIPTSVGATFLEEWSSSYLPAAVVNPLTTPAEVSSSRLPPPSSSSSLSLSSNASKRLINCDKYGKVRTPENCKYQYGCANLLSSALRTFLMAMIKVPNEIRINFYGILWYQGENDASLPEQEAQSYGYRFDSFLNKYNSSLEFATIKLRALHKVVNLPLKIRNYESRIERDVYPLISVAITTTRSRQCLHRDIIRCSQLEKKGRVIEGETCQLIVDVVDAFGLPLREDNVHIDTGAIFELGKCMHTSFNRLVKAIESSQRSTAWREFLQVEVNENPGYSMLSAEIYKGESLYISLKDKIKLILEKEGSSGGSSIVLDIARQRSFSSHTRSKVENNAATFPILRSGLKACNFTYGEIDFIDFCRVLSLAKIYHGESFVDLGSGTGVLLAAALLGGFGFQRITGIELSTTKVFESRLLLTELIPYCSSEELEVVEGNFLEVCWASYDVVYTCSTCYAQDQMAQIENLAYKLKVGARIIFVDKQPFEQHKYKHMADQCDQNDDIPVSCFKQIGSCQCKTSWGTADIYIYEKYVC